MRRLGREKGEDCGDRGGCEEGSVVRHDGIFMRRDAPISGCLLIRRDPYLWNISSGKWVNSTHVLLFVVEIAIKIIIVATESYLRVHYS